MAEKRAGKRKGNPASGVEKQVRAAIKRSGAGTEGAVIWRRSDGAWCIGNECIVFNPKSGSVSIEVNQGRGCDDAEIAKLAESIAEQVGKGAHTVYRIRKAR